MSVLDHDQSPDPRGSLLRYLDGSLPTEDVTRLNEALKSDAGLRRDFAELLVQQVQLNDLGCESRAEAGVLTTMSETDSNVLVKGQSFSAAETATAAFVRKEPTEMAGWRGRWRMPLALAAGIALLLALSVWLFPRTNNEPTLALAPSATVIIDRGTESFQARGEVKLQPGDVLKVTGTNLVTIDYGNEPTRVSIRTNSELKILAWSSGKRFELRRGRIEASVARQRPWQPMIWVTAEAEARVVGTEFTLSATASATQLAVSEGRVQFTGKDDGTVVQVTAGQYAVAAAGRELTALPATGSVRREWWTGMPATNLYGLQIDPRFPDHPDGWDLVQALELEPVKTNRFVVRFSGYLHPPVTGEYEFWVAGDNSAQLFMSPDGDPAGMELIGVTDGTSRGRRDWDEPRFRGSSQWQPPVPLEAGRIYYLEAIVLIKHGEGHLSVAWKRPGGERELVTGEFLSPSKPK